jgi:hypothetical protein
MYDDIVYYSGGNGSSQTVPLANNNTMQVEGISDDRKYEKRI